MEKLYIIGNGFDLYHGLPTSYQCFLCYMLRTHLEDAKQIGHIFDRTDYEKPWSDFERNLGKEVEIHLFKAQEGEKEYIGELKAFDKDSVTLLFEDDVEASFERSNLSMIRQYIDFSDL